MAKSKAQQAAIAISMKKAGKSPKKMLKGGRSSYMERMRTYQEGGMNTAQRKDRYMQDLINQQQEEQELQNQANRPAIASYYRGDITDPNYFDKKSKATDAAIKRLSENREQNVYQPQREKAKVKFDEATRYNDMLGRATNPYQYQAGGLNQTAMYGDPRMSDQLMQNIIYEQSDNQKALEEEARRAEEGDAIARAEAEQALQRQYAIGNRIEATGQSALRAGAQGLAKIAADPLKGQTPNFAGAMIPNAADATASLSSGTAAAAKGALTDAATGAVTDAATDAVTDVATDAAAKGLGKLGTFASKYTNVGHAKAFSPYAIAGNLAGQGIKYLSDDQDATTMNFGEGAGGVVSGMASGAGFGSILGPAGTVAGGIVGGLYGLGKGLYQRNQARNTIGNLEQEQEDSRAQIGARMRAEGVKSRSYSGYDFGRTLAKNGGPRMYQTAGFDMSMLANNPIKNVPAPRQDVLTSYSDAELAANRAKGNEVAFNNRMDILGDNLHSAGQYIKENPLDAVQVGLGGIAIGADGIPVIGTAASGIADAVNAGISGSRAAYYAKKGDTNKAGFYSMAAGLDGLAAVPGVGNAAGATKMGMLLNKASHLAHGPIHVAHQGAKAITAGKAATLGTSSLSAKNTFKQGGVKLPGGTMNPIPGSDAVEFKGKSHKQGGILLDEQTEVEGGETMDKVTMKDEGPSDYFFSKYLKLGGRSYAQRHKDILKKGGTQQDIDALAMSQEKTAGRNPGVVEMERGGAYQYQFGGYGITNNDYSNPPLRDLSGLSSSQLNAEIQKVGADPRLNQYAKDKQLTALYGQLNSSKKGTPVPSVMGLLQKEPSGYFRSTPGNFGKLGEYENAPAAQTPTSTNTSTSTAPKATVAPLPTAGPVDEDQVMFDNEQEAMAGLQPLPTIDTSPAAKGKSSNDDLIMENVDAQIANLEAKKEQIGLTKQEERALKRMYRDVPMGAKIAGAAQMLPAAYAFLRKEKSQKLMGPAGRIGSPDLERADYNNERMQNASANRSMGKFIETSGGGPASIISKMAGYSKKQQGDMQIASAEQRANSAIQAQEAQMAQAADTANTRNAMMVDQVNTQMIESQRVADENRRYMALDAAVKSGAGYMGDVMSYKADERLARSLGTMGIYERERLGKSLLGKVNPRTGKTYTKADIAEIYNINLEDPGIAKEAEAAKTKSKG